MIPKDHQAALVAGDWVEVGAGRIGAVVMRAWDQEGSPGYLCRVHHQEPLVFVWDSGVEKGVYQHRKATS